jgi:glycosyltransferase involved in cell wall biosynthesis
MNSPLLSVCLITYNHQDYIKQAIEGVLMQKVNFEFELIISDDCSKDNTQTIIKEYKDKHPDFVKVILRQKNVGAAQNFIELISTPKSKYIAYLEGDDYWTDPLKLQKQVDFLESNTDYEVCFTNINIINAEGKIVKDQFIPSKRRKSYEHKHLPIWAPTLTRVFRNRDFSPIDSDVPGQDVFWLLYQSKFGKIKFLDEITGTYRLHDGSIYSSHSIVKKKEAIFLTYLECLKLIDSFLFPKYFGNLFKKLVELKELDKGIFKTNENLLKKAYHNYISNFSMYERFKVGISFMLVSLPFIYKYASINVMVIRILNRLFVHNQYKNE